MTAVSPYLRAAGELGPDVGARVCAQIAAWAGCGDGKWEHVAGNIEREIALDVAVFGALLREFIEATSAGKSPEEAWETTCYGYKLRGPIMADGQRPRVLGRALALQQYSGLVVNAPGSDVTDELAAERLIRGLAGRPSIPARRQRLLQAAGLGRYVLWATFNPSAHDSDPFLALPRTRAAVRDALGLGHYKPSDVLVLVAYHSDVPTVFPLHRPTVADAGNSEYYRPHADPAHPHGWTRPLTPGLDGQPEVVHPEIRGLGLLLPFHVT